MAVIGRFAPSPTGELHFGSLITAIASFCMAKQAGGQWLVRIEDTDWQRCQPHYSQSILHTLDKFALHWDGKVIYQSQRQPIYNQALASLKQHIYACNCSRRQLHAHAKKNNCHSAIYPRLCINKTLDHQQHKVRLVLPNYNLAFYDHIQGLQCANPQHTLGDMVLRRDKQSHHMVNYILAVTIDDAEQGITQIVRGLDILPLTFAQLHLACLLKLPLIGNFNHLPLACHVNGQKLSKQNLARAIASDYLNETDIAQHIAHALQALKQPKVSLDTPARMLAQATAQWQLKPLKGVTRYKDFFV